MPKPRVLVFGDSNSWGTLADGSDMRYGPRWPVVMAEKLGVELIEDALPGRTTVHDDPQMHGSVQNGRAGLEMALYSHRPIDLLILMLGTNDMKTRFAPSADKIAHNILRLMKLAVRVGGGPGAWGDVTPPRMMVVVPVELGPQADDPNWERHDEWLGGRAASRELASALRPICASRGVALFEAGKVVTASDQDPIHLDAEAHPVLGAAIGDWIKDQRLLA